MHRGSTILIVVLSAVLGAGVARVSAVEQGWVWAITISLLGNYILDSRLFLG